MKTRTRGCLFVLFAAIVTTALRAEAVLQCQQVDVSSGPVQVPMGSLTFLVSATCPAGTSVTGGSCEREPFATLQMVEFTTIGDRPNVANNRWDCDYLVRNDGPEPVTPTGIAHAVCCACDLEVQMPVLGSGAAVVAVGVLLVIALLALRATRTG